MDSLQAVVFWVALFQRESRSVPQLAVRNASCSEQIASQASARSRSTLPPLPT